MDRCTGRHCRPVLQLPTGQSCSWQTAGPDKLLALTDGDPGAHGNEQGASKQSELDGGNEAKLERGQDVDEGSGHGRQRVAGKTQPAEQGTAGRHSQRTLRPAQASKNKRPTVGRPCSKQQQPQMSSLPCRTVQVGGGSAMVLRKAGADLPNLSLPHLSPLPVTVPTHSLNLKNPI